MKVCIDARTATPHFPGIGRYVRSLAAELPAWLALDDRLTFLTPPVGIDLPADSNISAVPTPVSPFSFSQQWQIPFLLSKLRPDLYHSPYYLMPYCPLRSIVLTVYDLIPLHFPELVSARARLLFRLTTRLALASARQVIAISEATRQDFLKAFHLPETKITAIPLAADARYRPQAKAEIERVCQKWGLSPGFGLYVGINKPHKNLIKLLEAWARLGRTSPRLVVAGAWDSKYPQVREKAAALNLLEQVVFLGPVPESDLPGLYSSAGFFVFPSLYEGFGLPVLEALACGTPVVCANTSSLPEVAGPAALYFDPHQVESISAALGRILSEPALRQDLSAQAVQQAARFSWQRTAQETNLIYREIIGGR